MMSLIKSKVKRDQLVVKIQSNTARVKRRERQVSDWEVGYNGASADWRSRGFDRREHRLYPVKSRLLHGRSLGSQTNRPPKQLGRLLLGKLS
jgi:hypothetical protein